MANNFFDLVKDSFFNPFTNANKRYNYDLLQLINSKMSLDNLQVVKDDIVEWIVDYLENYPINLKNDENDIEEKDKRTFALNKVNYFVKCGWLIEDYEGLRVTYQMDENAIKVLSTLENAVKDDDKSLEFSGYVHDIYNNLHMMKFDEATSVVEQIYDRSKGLNSMLRGLNVSIKKYLTKLISENEAKPKEILETMFNEYHKKVVLKTFKNFREKDNPSKYKGRIKNRIAFFLEEENLNKMVENYLLTKGKSENGEEASKEEARNFFISRLEYVDEQFDEIEYHLEKLNSKNTTYIKTANSRLNFLLNEEMDVEGRLIDCLKTLCLVSDDFEFDEFEIFTGLNMDEYSLYKPVNKRTKPKTKPLEEDVIEDDPEFIRRSQERLFRDNAFSVGEIDKYIMKALGDKKDMLASEIKTSSFDDVLKVFLAGVYSQNMSISYRVEFLESTFRAQGYKMIDFRIERK